MSIFTIDYAARLWTTVEVPFLARLPPWKVRLKWASRAHRVIDLLASLAYYLSTLFSLDLRVLRVLRLLRFFKLSRYSPALHTLLRVPRNERRSLSAAGLLLSAALLQSATGMHSIEGEGQPDKFGSVPQAADWAMQRKPAYQTRCSRPAMSSGVGRAAASKRGQTARRRPGA